MLIIGEFYEVNVEGEKEIAILTDVKSNLISVITTTGKIVNTVIDNVLRPVETPQIPR